jgi:hypothetical protein
VGGVVCICDYARPVLTCWWSEVEADCNRTAPECAGRWLFDFMREGSGLTGINVWSYGDTDEWEEAGNMNYFDATIPPPG